MADSAPKPAPTSLGSCQIPYLTTHTSCHHCGKCPDRDIPNTTPLKRCTGCAVTLYCNRDCQKAAWAQHKIFCRSKSGPGTANVGHEELGYATPLSLLHAIKEWEKIHSFTLIAITHIALHTHGGVDHNLAAPHSMLFVLEAIVDDSDHSGHVSAAFRIIDARIAHRDDLSCLRPHWEEDQVADRERALARVRSREVIPNPALAGPFPVTFMVRGSDAVLYHFYGVYRPLLHPVDASPDALTRLAFDDLNLLLIRLIPHGIVFGPPEDTSQTFPAAGKYFPAGRKGWKKISMPNIWEGLLEPLMASHPSDFVSGLPLERIWALCESW